MPATRNLARVVLAFAALALGAAVALPAEAGRLKATVYLLTQTRIPKKLTEKGLIRFAKSHRARVLRESNEPKQSDRKWRGTLVVSFNKPVGDLEFQVLFYDIQDGAPRFVEDMSTFVNDRKQKTFVQKIKMPRKRFKPNRKMELVVTVRRQEVGRLKFNMVGEHKRHSGTVSFSDKER